MCCGKGSKGTMCFNSLNIVQEGPQMTLFNLKKYAQIFTVSLVGISTTIRHYFKFRIGRIRLRECSLNN